MEHENMENITVRAVSPEETEKIRKLFEDVYSETFSDPVPDFSEATKGERLYAALLQRLQPLPERQNQRIVSQTDTDQAGQQEDQVLGFGIAGEKQHREKQLNGGDHPQHNAHVR